MGKSKAPPPPDYRGAAEAQAEASREITTDQTWANRPNLNTPWGSQTWQSQRVVDPATGKPVTQWSSQINLSPQQQAALDSQMAVQTGRSQAAEDMLGRATGALGAPIDYSDISPGADRIESSDEWRQRAQDAALDFQRPLQEERRASLENQLANMGLTRGSEAWNREMRRLSDQDARDNLQVFDSARSEAALGMDMALRSGNFNQALRQQEIAEMMARRNAPLNELNALLTGQQVQSPQMPSFTTAQQSQAPQYLSAANMQYGAAMDAYNAENAGFSNLLGGLAGLGGAAMGAGGWGGLFKL